MKRIVHPRCFLSTVIFVSCTAGSIFAGSATWSTAPANGNWNSAANWSPVTVPDGPADTATFESSSIFNVLISADTDVNGITFTPLAHLTHYFITVSPTQTLTISGTGITNDSGSAQRFVTASDGSGHAGTLEFKGDATAGNMMAINNSGARTRMFGAASGATIFSDTSSAGSATINNNSSPARGAAGGETVFNDTSSAGSAMINNNSSTLGGASATFFNDSSTADSAIINNHRITIFSDSSTAGNATINNEFGSFLTLFVDASSAGSATITNEGSPVNTHGTPGTTTLFRDGASAGSATIINKAGTGEGAGGAAEFQGGSAGNATIINEGATVSVAIGSRTDFDLASPGTPTGRSSAGNATLIADGGVGLSGGGRISFFYNSSGGAARIEVFGNGSLDISPHDAPGLTIGSIEGDGKVFLGGNNLTIGNNGLSTVFAGVMQDGDPFNGGRTGGSLTKIGKGTLTLSRGNRYTGDTTINGGVLNVNGSIVSPNTLVNPGGTLGGNGTVGGNVINNAVVAPGDSPGTLHVGGNYSQSSGGTVEIDIASLLSFDQLAVSGTASLSGTLDVTLDGYTGHAGDMFTILTSPGLTGNFLNLDLPELSNGLFFNERLTSTDVILTVSGSTNAPDSGSTLLLMAAALGALLGLRQVIASHAKPIYLKHR
jgi:autotransporter-associated beta strand protein